MDLGKTNVYLEKDVGLDETNLYYKLFILNSF